MTSLTKAGTERKRVNPGTPIEDRLALHVASTESGCLVWLGATNGRGYGVLAINRRNHYAHRVAYEYFTGERIPEGMQIDHLCRNPSCCNPEHLEPVTCQENVRRGFSPGAIARRRDLCLYGHPYADFGKEWRGRRQCRLCNVIYARLWREVPYAEAMRRKHSGETVVDLAAYFALPSSADEVAAVAAELLAVDVEVEQLARSA